METRGRKPKGDQKRDKHLKVRISEKELELLKFTVTGFNKKWGTKYSETDLIIHSVDFIRKMSKLYLPGETDPDTHNAFNAFDPLAEPIQ